MTHIFHIWILRYFLSPKPCLPGLSFVPSNSQLQAALRLSVKDQHVTQLVIESSDEEVEIGSMMWVVWWRWDIYPSGDLGRSCCYFLKPSSFMVLCQACYLYVFNLVLWKCGQYLKCSRFIYISCSGSHTVRYANLTYFLGGRLNLRHLGCKNPERICLHLSGLT